MWSELYHLMDGKAWYCLGTVCGEHMMDGETMFIYAVNLVVLIHVDVLYKMFMLGQ